MSTRALRPTVPGSAPAAVPSLAELQASATGAPAPPPADEPLTPREVKIGVEWHDPETGAEHRASLTSRAPDGNGLLAIERFAVGLCGGQPIERFHPAQRIHFTALARIGIQCRDVETEAPGLWGALLCQPPNLADLENEPGLALQLAGVLAEHGRRCFRGDGSAGPGGPRVARVVAPWAEAPAGSGSGAGAGRQGTAP